MPSGTRRPPGPLSRAIANILSDALGDAGIGQTELGEVVGISQSQLSKLLRAERALTIDELDRLCTALALDLIDVITRADSARHP